MRECGECRQEIAINDPQMRMITAGSDASSDAMWHLVCVDEKQIVERIRREKHFHLDEHPSGETDGTPCMCSPLTGSEEGDQK